MMKLYSKINCGLGPFINRQRQYGGRSIIYPTNTFKYQRQFLLTVLFSMKTFKIQHPEIQETFRE